MGEDTHSCLLPSKHRVHARTALPSRVAAGLAVAMSLTLSPCGRARKADTQTKPSSSTCYLCDTSQVP